jgi:hypothetical protein
LRQIGLAFNSFAHDHNGAMPMAVPVAAGGSENSPGTPTWPAGNSFSRSVTSKLLLTI